MFDYAQLRLFLSCICDCDHLGGMYITELP